MCFPFTGSIDKAPICVCINKKYASGSGTFTSDAGSTESKIIDTEPAWTGRKKINFFKGWVVEYPVDSGTYYKVTGSEWDTVSEPNTNIIKIETIAGFTSGLSYKLLYYPQQEFKIADHAITSVDSVYIDYGNGTGWEKAVIASSNLTNATFVISTDFDGSTAIFDEDSTKVKVLFVGKNPDGNVSDIVSDLCQTYGGLPADALDSSSFAASQTATELIINKYIKEPIFIRDVIDKLILSIFAYFPTGLNGKLYFIVWTTTRTTGYDEFQDYEYFSFIVSDIGSDLRNKIAVGYAINHNTKEHQYTDLTNLPSIYKYSEREKEVIDTDLTTESDGNILAQRYIWVVNQPGRYVEFETNLRPLQKTIGDKIYLTKSKSPNSDAGGMDQVLMEITGIERDMMRGTTRIQCVDTRGLGASSGIWMAPDAPDYVDATPAEKSVSGFVSDENGYILYPEGKDKSLWW